jgi:hypothetical protein
VASVQKFTSASMIQMLRHNNRSIKEPSNTSIDKARSHLNYSFPLNHHGLSDYRYYKNLVGEKYLYGRRSAREETAITGCGWVVTLPKELQGQPEKEAAFFKGVFDFISERYGQDNILNNAIHYDESGLPHIHVIFCPVTTLDHEKVHYKTQKTAHAEKLESGRYEYAYRFKYDETGEKIPIKNYAKMSDYYDEKIDCNSVLNKIELKNFHPDLQHYLQAQGIEGAVITGKTGGVNFSVQELKDFTAHTGLHLEDVKEIQKNKSLLESYVAHHTRLQELEQIILEKENCMEALQHENQVKEDALTLASQHAESLEKKLSELEQQLDEKQQELTLAKHQIQELEKEKTMERSKSDVPAEWSRAASGWDEHTQASWDRQTPEKSWDR